MELTLQIAQRLGINDQRLVHIRRGALLHDIGKMAFPDSILHKPGPLDAGEWEVMRQHPVYSYELLQDIPFLRASLDIPYYHHEHWDGSGYPCGLKGEEIPLSARIFALVDVWDALCSDKPYRNALPHHQVIEYLKNEAGSHFDPDLASVFIELIQGKSWSLSHDSEGVEK